MAQRGILIILLALCYLGCTDRPERLDVIDYQRWVKANDELTVKKIIDPYTISVFWEPSDYSALKKVHISRTISEGEFARAKQAVDPYQYGWFKIASTNGETPVLRSGIGGLMAYQERVSYLSFQIQQDIYLKQNGKTYPCVLHHFERSYDLAPYVICSFAFKREDLEYQDVTFVFDDQHFGLGPVKLSFDLSVLNRQPNLKM